MSSSKPFSRARGVGGAHPPGHPWRALLLGALLLLAGCDGIGVVVAPDHREYLRSGAYRYSAWTDRGRGTWWGYVDLRVAIDGTVRGRYHLPRQCSDRFGYAIDCYGQVRGRIHRDGLIRFDFDDGWLRHEGEAYRGWEVFGWWDSRYPGGHGSGEFELVRR